MAVATCWFTGLSSANRIRSAWRDSALVGHRSVEEGGVVRRSRWGGAAQRLHSSVGGGCFVHGHALRPQHVPENPPVGFVVIHHEKPASSKGHGGASRSLRRCFDRKGEGEAELAAAAHLARH